MTNRTINLEKKLTVYQPEIWGSYSKWFAVSSGGEFTAVRTRDAGNVWNGEKNVFVYNTEGQLVSSMGNCHGGEAGIAFWPNKYHLLLPGCDPDFSLKSKDRDGIKQYAIGASLHDFALPFDSTPLSGIRAEILGVSDSGRYVLGTKGGVYCIDTAQKKVISVKTDLLNPSYMYTIFSGNENYVLIRNPFTWIGDCLISLPNCEVLSIENIVGHSHFLCFSPQGDSFCSAELAQQSSLSTGLTSYCVTFRSLTDPDSSPKLFSSAYHSLPVVAAFSNDGAFCAVACSNGDLYLQPTDAPESYAKALINNLDSEPIIIMKFSQDGRLLLVVQSDSVSIWNCTF